MRNLFNADNFVMRALGRFCDLIFLNAAFLISCIPIFTIGAALSSMYYVAIKLIRKEDISIFSTYFKTFRANFKQSTCLFLPWLFAMIFFITDIFIIHKVIDPVYRPLQYPIWLIIFALVSIIIYAFPQISLYENSTKQILKNSVLLSLSNIPTTIFIVILHFAVYVFCTGSGDALVLVFSITIFFGCAGMAYFCSLFLSRILEKCEEPKEELAEDENIENL